MSDSIDVDESYEFTPPVHDVNRHHHRDDAVVDVYGNVGVGNRPIIIDKESIPPRIHEAGYTFFPKFQHSWPKYEAEATFEIRDASYFFHWVDNNLGSSSLKIYTNVGVAITTWRRSSSLWKKTAHACPPTHSVNPPGMLGP